MPGRLPTRRRKVRPNSRRIRCAARRAHPRRADRRGARRGRRRGVDRLGRADAGCGAQRVRRVRSSISSGSVGAGRPRAAASASVRGGGAGRAVAARRSPSRRSAAGRRRCSARAPDARRPPAASPATPPEYQMPAWWISTGCGVRRSVHRRIALSRIGLEVVLWTPLTKARGGWDGRDGAVSGAPEGRPTGPPAAVYRGDRNAGWSTGSPLGSNLEPTG